MKTLIFLLLFPCISFAATQITFTWNMDDITDVEGYKVYHSLDNGMTNKTLHTECEPSTNVDNAYTMVCNNFPLDQETFITINAFTDTREVASDVLSLDKSYAPTIINITFE